tara:strand:+ start:3175 stop:3378 length:204 start_codon:yes stop_codon:yes gene_type:complete
MPYIILKKELKRIYGEWEKVFPEGTEMFVSWDKYKTFIKEGYCNKIKVDIPKKTKLKKETKKTNKKK